MYMALKEFCVTNKGDFSYKGDYRLNNNPAFYTCTKKGELFFQAKDRYLGSRNVGGNVFSFDYHQIDLVEVSNSIEGYKAARRLGYKGPESSKEIEDRKKVEKAILKAQQRYQSLFESKTNLFFIMDDRGDFIDANDFMLDLFEYEKEDITNVNYLQLLQSPIESRYVKETS